MLLIAQWLASSDMTCNRTKERAHILLLKVSVQPLNLNGMSHLYINSEEMPILDNDVAINY